MSLYFATKDDLPFIVRYLLQNEWQHTMLSSRFYANGKFFFPSQSLIVLQWEQDQVCGVFFSDQKGYVFLSQSHENSTIIKEFFRHTCAYCLPFCLIGTEKIINFAIDFFMPNIRLSIDYHIMTSTSIPTHIHHPYQIFYTQPSHYYDLLPLEIAYQKEEVITREITHETLLALQKNYQHRIQAEVGLHAVFEQEIIGKLSLNYVAHHYTQLGSVYTQLPWRNKGVATSLIKEILIYNEKNNKKISLFVKKNNQAAINLYQKLHFNIIGNLKIAYLS